MKMDNTSAAHKSRLSCQTWVDQNGWPTTSSQGLAINPHIDSQHHSLSSSCDQTASYNHLQASSQSCMNTMSSGNSNQNPALFSTSHMNNVISSNSIFSPSAPHLMSFAQQVPHTSSMQAATNQGKTLPLTSFHQSNQKLQPCRSQHLPSLSANRAYKSFQTQSVSQGLPHGLPDQSFSLSSCGSGVDMSQATFGGLPEVSAGVDGSSNSYGSTSLEQPQWMSSSHGKGAVNESVSAAQVNKHPSQEVDREKRRSLVLNRAQLLKQLESINKLLESLPPEDDVEQLPNEAFQTETIDAQQIQQQEEENLSDNPEDPESPAGSVEMELKYSESEDDDNDDDAPQSDGNVSDSQSEKTEDSEDYSSPSSPTDDNPPTQGTDQSEGEQSAAPPMTSHTANQKKHSKIIVAALANEKETRSGGKRNYCLFCSKAVQKMARHLTHFHCEKAEVAAAFQYPVNSIERRRLWQKLIREGNFAHNKNVLKTGEGQLAVRRRQKNASEATEFVHCICCHALIIKKNLWRHLRDCPEKDKIEPQRKRKRIVSHYVLQSKNCEDLSEGFRNTLGEMVYDEVTETIMEDPILLQFGEQMFTLQDDKKPGYIRQNLRYVTRLMLEAQKSTPMQSLEDFFNPSNFQHVVSTVKVIAGYDPEKKTYSTPSLAFKIGYHLQKVCDIVKNNAEKSGDANVVKSCDKFHSLYQKKWTKLISSRALKNIKEIKKKNDKDEPLVEDVKLLHQHMENAQELAEKKLKESVSTENYVALVRVVLARTIAFNRRKPGDVASISLTAFSSRKKSDVLDDMDVSVSDLERTLCGFFSRVDIKGNCGRMLPILLKPSFESAIELLISVRGECGVLSDNTFVFARPEVLSAYRGCECIRRYVKECGAQNPSTLTAVKLRKHFSTMLRLIHLNKDETRQIFGSEDQIQAQRNGVMCADPDLEPGGSHHKTKPKWDEAEVRAVEKHLTRFIKERRLPQKDDCVRCLEAEPRALRNRSWKGVKDYVRNRITTLQRQSGSSKTSSKTSKRRRREEPRQRPVKSKRPTGQAGSEHPGVVSGPNAESETPDQQPPGETSHSKTSNEKSRGKDFRHKTKPKWGEAEVRAVEKHLMRFIKDHRLPQKDDCVRCLDAEPRALRNRSWKGVKDYVRNRITTLQRQSGSSKTLSKTSKKRRREEPRQRSVGSQPSDETTSERHQVVSSSGYEPADPKQQQQKHGASTKKTSAHTSDKSQGKGLHQKTKLKWDESEVNAIEKHLMRFIKDHRLPQKDDCVRCLDAEPHALRNRSWKGVKDYVRNRITTLQRLNGTSKTSKKSRTSHHEQW